VAEPFFEHAQYFEDLLRGRRRHERKEFRPAAVRGALQKAQEFRVRPFTRPAPSWPSRRRST
jgi:hypothetical protein